MSHNTVSKADMPKMASNWGAGFADRNNMKKCSPLGILLGDSVSVLLKAIQKSNRIAHHVRWRSWHGGQVLVGIHPLYARRRARPIGQLPGFDSCMRGGSSS